MDWEKNAKGKGKKVSEAKASFYGFAVSVFLCLRRFWFHVSYFWVSMASPFFLLNRAIVRLYKKIVNLKSYLVNRKFSLFLP